MLDRLEKDQQIRPGKHGTRQSRSTLRAGRFSAHLSEHDRGAIDESQRVRRNEQEPSETAVDEPFPARRLSLFQQENDAYSQSGGKNQLAIKANLRDLIQNLQVAGKGKGNGEDSDDAWEVAAENLRPDNSSQPKTRRRIKPHHKRMKTSDSQQTTADRVIEWGTAVRAVIQARKGMPP